MKVPVVRRKYGLSRFDPLDEFSEFQERMMDIFKGLSPRSMFNLLPEVEGMCCPAIDLYETENEVVVNASIPGATKENVEINVGEQEVSIKGEMHREKESKEEAYYSQEMAYGSFYRTIPLPHEVKSEEAKAKLKDGILEIRIPKSAKAVAGKKVEIES